MDFKTPIEMPRGTHYGSNYFIVYSAKLKRNVKFYSNLEYFNYLTVECDPDVKTFCEQPLRVPVNLDGEVHEVVFDMYIEKFNGYSELQEVKYDIDVSGKSKNAVRTQEQIRREEAWCEQNGYNFSVRTEKDIVKGRFHMENLHLMAARIRRYSPVDPSFYEERIRRILAVNKVATYRDLVEAKALPIGNEMNFLFYLYMKKAVTFDMYDQPFNYGTEVKICKG